MQEIGILSLFLPSLACLISIICVIGAAEVTAATPVLTEFVTDQEYQNSFEVRINCFLWKNGFLDSRVFLGSQLTQQTPQISPTDSENSTLKIS